MSGPDGRTQSAATERGRHGGESGMVLAELRDVAGSYGIEVTGLRRRELISSIRRAERHGEPAMPRPPWSGAPVELRETYRRLANGTVIKRDSDGNVAVWTDGTTEDVDGLVAAEHLALEEAFDVQLLDGQSLATKDKDLPASAPPARLLTAASLLLKPDERENWLGELDTTRWELRNDRRARRRATWTFARALGESLLTSWRHGGDPSQEMS